MLRQLRQLTLAALASAALAGCGGGDEGAGGGETAGGERAAGQAVEIEFWNYWDGNNAEAISELVDEFNRTHPDIRVRTVSFPWDQLNSKLQAARAGGDLPDVAAADIAWMANLHRSGALVDLTEPAKAEADLDDFYPELLRYSEHEGRIQALPVSTNNLALFYNKDLFRKAGLDPEAPPETWEELRAAAKAIAGLGGGVQGFEIYTQPGEGLTWQFQPYLWQAGGDYLMPPEYREPAFNNEAGRKALGFLVGLIQQDKVTQAGEWGAFDKGQAGMRVDGSWMVGIYKEQAPFEFGTAMIPVCDGCEPATNMGGEQVVVFESTPQNEAAAVEFVLWLTSTETQVEWDKRTAFMPVRRSVAEHEEFRAWVESEPRFAAFAEQQQYARARPPIPEYAATSDAFSKALEPAFHGRVSVEQALANAEEAVRSALAG